MDDEKVNPFAPVVTIDELGSSTKFVDGLLEREGDLLLIYNGAALPQRCLVTGKKTEFSEEVYLSWHSPWVYLLLFPFILPYFLFAGVCQKRATLQLPIAKELLDKHRNHVRTGSSMMIAATVTFLVLLAIDFSSLRSWLAPLYSITLLVGLLGFMAASSQAASFDVKQMTDQLLVLRGVHEEFLKHIPSRI